jgi:hypothetical protein
MERLIRERAVAPLDADTPALTPQERRSCWEFCLGMAEFLGGLIRDRVVDRKSAKQLARLEWICIKGTYVFATRDPMLRLEQHRYTELCGCLAVAFAVIVDDPDGLRDLCAAVLGCHRFWPNGDRKEPAEAEALVSENRLRRLKDWEDARSPVAWVKDRAISVHERDHECGGAIREADALYRTPKNKRSSAESLAFDCRENAGTRDVISLEEVADVPAEAHATLSSSRRMRVNALKAAVQDDEDLRAYVSLRLQGHKPRAAWGRLGWTATFGKAIDRRFRRLRQKVKESGFEYEAREIQSNPGFSDASCTVIKERLRISVSSNAESTLSGRVVYEPRSSGGETPSVNRQKTNEK